jgi:hypothetical protein
MVEQVKSAENSLRQLRKQQRQVEASKGYTPEAKQQRLDAIKARMDKIMGDVRRSYFDKKSTGN